MIRTKEVEIDGTKYEIKPLRGGDIGKFFVVLKTFSGIKEDSDESAILEKLDDDVAVALHYVCTQSLVHAGVKMSEDELDMYVSQNMFTLMGPVMEVNMPQKQ